MKKKWKMKALIIVIIMVIKPSAEAVYIIKSIKYQETNWFSEKLNLILMKSKITSIIEKNKIIKEIDETENKTLTIDTTIGYRKVKYYEHIFMDWFFVKNDSILIHYNVYTNHILYYHKKWTEIELNISEFINKNFNPTDFFWKQLVIFPDEDDCKKIYTFTDEVKFPIACWEVRYKNGTTFMYDSNGECIGQGIPTPSNDVLTLSGYDKNTPHDPWHYWRANADKWFNKWFNIVISIGRPTNEQISYYLRDAKSEYFYEIAHSGGEPTRFQTSNDGIFYTAYEIKEDMANREPIKLAILCSCEAMQRTDLGTLSYEFRKGQIYNTITIGYVGMGSCPGWYDSLDWQDAMFNYMDRGYSVKNAFNLATAFYPKISDCVKFVGDNEQRIIDDNFQTYSFFHLIKVLKTRMISINI